jgi:hypothetical protein
MNRFLILVSHSPFRLVEAAWEHVVFGDGVQQGPGWVLPVVIIQWRRCDKQATQFPACDTLEMYFYMKSTEFFYVTTRGPVGRSLLVFRRNPLHPFSGKRINRAWKKWYCYRDREDRYPEQTNRRRCRSVLVHPRLRFHITFAFQHSAHSSAVKVKAAYSFETLVTINQSTRRPIFISTAMRTTKRARPIPLSCVWERLYNWVTTYNH